jgi:hypothetical protein
MICACGYGWHYATIDTLAWWGDVKVEAVAARCASCPRCKGADVKLESVESSDAPRPGRTTAEQGAA